MSQIRTVGAERDIGRRKRRFLYGGTDGSNPVPSSSEPATKLASCIAAVPRTGELIRVSPLTSAQYRDPLNLDQQFRTCETSDGNQRTRRKIIAEDLLSQLRKPVTIAGVAIGGGWVSGRA